MANSVYLEVDASECAEAIAELKSGMKPEQFRRAMYGVVKRASGHVRKILREDLPKEYAVKPAEVGRAVQSPRLSNGDGGSGVGCSIPIRGVRRGIGGNGEHFAAYGYRKGWNSLKGKYTVKSKILQGRMSNFPQHMDGYGGKPPFRNMPGSTLGGATFTREGKERLPIWPVYGVAVPQMPMNRSREEVEDDIKDYLVKEMDRRLCQFKRAGK